MLTMVRERTMLFPMDKALENVKILNEGEEDGWTYKVIERGIYGEIAVYDFDGEYLGSF